MTGKNSAIVVNVDGRKVNLGYRPGLIVAQRIVGGYIELVKARSSKTGKVVTLVVNEEGKLRGLPVNRTITAEYGPSIYKGYVVGNVIVLTGWGTVGM